MIQAAVMGYGTVGSGVVEVIEKNKEEINKKAGEENGVWTMYGMDWDDPYRIRSFRELINWINEIAFL